MVGCLGGFLSKSFHVWLGVVELRVQQEPRVIGCLVTVQVEEVACRFL